MRSSYQAFIWKNALVAFCPVPTPDGCGWNVTDNHIQADWISTEDIMPKQLADVLELKVEDTELDDDVQEDDVVDNIVDVIFDDEDDDSVVDPHVM